MIRPTTRSRIAALSITALALVAVGCVSVAPGGSPTASIATPTPTTSATATATTPATGTPTLPPTAPPTDTPTDAPTAAPTAPPTDTPTDAPTAPPTDGVTPPPSGTATELDFSADPRYGLHELSAGFTPDPFTVTMTSGGPVNASYISGCNGFAAVAPDVKVRYTAASATILRFYFTPDDLEADTTLIINDPNGQWLCDDDAYSPHPAVNADPTLGESVRHLGRQL